MLTPGGSASGEARANRRVAVLVHELAHALGAGYRELGRELAEVVVESVAYVVCAGAGLDVSAEAVPYVALGRRAAA